jgi:hypothetical protein
MLIKRWEVCAKYNDGKTCRFRADGFYWIDGLHGIQPSLGMDIRLFKEKIGNRAPCSARSAEDLINGSPEDVAPFVEYCPPRAPEVATS